MTSISVGVLREYTAVVDFALNWDNRKQESVKVKKGEVLFYDGVTVTYKKRNGEQTSGSCSGLKTAITVAHWLVPTVKGEEEDSFFTESKLETKKDFDALKGGNFNTFLAKEGTTTVIREEDLVVKRTPGVKATKTEMKSRNMEVVGDQVDVREVTLVNSSTSTGRKVKKITTVVRADEGGADSTQPIKGLKKIVAGEKKKGFLIDGSTPLTISDDMTLNDVNKITKTMPVVVAAEDSQDGVVVSKIDMSKNQVKEIEGITLKKTASVAKSAAATVGSSEKDISVKTTVSSGHTKITDIQSEGTVVSTIKTDKQKEALARAEARKKASAQTQKQIEAEVVKVEAKLDENTDYLSMLPEDWGTMHWVKKEKFIMELTDKEFIKFIMSVETVKAIQTACSERLKQLE